MLLEALLLLAHPPLHLLLLQLWLVPLPPSPPSLYLGLLLMSQGYH